MLARILTENKNYTDIVALVAKYFDGATIIKADGLWDSKIEHSLIIEILCDDNSNGNSMPVIREKIVQLAYKIRKHNKQDAVLIQFLQCESKLV